MRKLWKLPQVIHDLFQGVLRIEVLEAKDLVKKDIGVFKKGSSDPYVILRGTVWVNLGWTVILRAQSGMSSMQKWRLYCVKAKVTWGHLY